MIEYLSLKLNTDNFIYCDCVSSMYCSLLFMYIRPKINLWSNGKKPLNLNSFVSALRTKLFIFDREYLCAIFFCDTRQHK